MDVCVTVGRCVGGEGRPKGKGRRMSAESRRTCWRNERRETNVNRNERMIGMERRLTRWRNKKKSNLNPNRRMIGMERRATCWRNKKKK